MSMGSWLGLALIALAAWGVVAFLQKVATNHVSAESALLWCGVGLLSLQPELYPGKSLFHFSARCVTFALVSGVLNWLGTWAMFAAMRSGGKACVVVPLTALYPLVVVLATPLLLRESVSLTQGCGIACAVVAGVLLSK